MTPTQLADALERAGVGLWHNMTGKPYPYRSHLEEAEAILRELPEDESRAAAADVLARFGGYGRGYWSDEDEDALVALRAALASSPAPAGLDVERSLHSLMWPPHPGDGYVCSALCSCGEWQFDSGSPTALFTEMGLIQREWSAHVREEVAARAATRPAEDDMADIMQAATGGPDFTVKEWPESTRPAEDAGERP